MSYLSHFKNDIFISYRHASNASDDKWVDVFCEKLREHLVEYVGNVTMWRDDPGIRAGDLWRPEIVAALDTAAIFLAIISRTYFDSDVCREELDHFLARVKDPNEAIRCAIVPIFKHPPKPDQELPQELAAFDHHEFFEWDPPGSPRWREFIPGRDEKAAGDFSAALSRLAQDLTIQLEKLGGLMRKRMVATVYLARVGPELHTEREKLRADLLQRGYLVVPDRSYLWHASDFSAKIAGDLDAAQLCIHLVGRATSIESNTHERVRLQLELATEAMKHKGKPPPLVWIQPAKETDEAAQRVIDYVEQDLANDGVEYWQGSLEDFKTQIYDQLPKPTTSPSIAKSTDIALIVEESDIATTGEINDALVNKLKYNPERIKFSGSNPKEPSSFVKKLNRCGQCIIFWAAQPEEWVSEILALDALTGYLGKEKLCVYIAAPASPEKTTFRTNKARIIQATSTLNETELSDFLTVESSR